MARTTSDIKKETESKMKKTVEATQREFSTIRTGRAHTGLVEGVKVNYYGAPTPIKQLATISTPEPRLIVINPWDASILGEVEKAILAANIGITPNSDGKIIRITVPQLTQERREEMIKVLKKISEEGRVSLRTARRVANEEIDRLEKEKKITEDDRFSSKDDIQKMIDKYTKEIDNLLEAKEKEISGV